MTSPITKRISDARLRALRAVARVLGSVIFIPISAMAAWAFFGLDVAVKMDERFVERGDEVHTPFKVVYEEPDGNGAFGYMSYRPPDENESKPYPSDFKTPLSFLMSKKNGEFQYRYTKFSYRVIEDRGEEQVIEVDYVDDTYATSGRYRATESTIEPMWSSMFHYGTFFVGMGYICLPFALALFVFGQLMKRALLRASVVAPDSTGSHGAPGGKEA
jgi:hypothetical protein